MRILSAVLQLVALILILTALEFAAPALQQIIAPLLVTGLALNYWRKGRVNWLFAAGVVIFLFPELQTQIVGPLELHHVLLLFAGLFGIVEWWGQPPSGRHLPKLAIYAGLIVLLFGAITVLRLGNVESWHRMFVFAFFIFIAASMPFVLTTRKKVQNFMAVVTIGSLGTLLIGIGAYYIASITRFYFESPYLHISTVEGVPRIAGTLLDSNFLANQLLLVTPFVLGWLATVEKSNKKHRALLTVASVALIAGVLLTFSRSGYIGLGVTVLMLVLLLGLKKIKKILIVSVLGLVAAAALYPAFPFYSIYRTPTSIIDTETKESLLGNFDPRLIVQEYRARILDDPTLSDDERDALLARDVSSDSLGYRISFWRAGLNMFRDYPITGVGVGQFRYRYDQYANTPFLRQPDAHNIYVELLAETGIIGTAAFGVLLLAVFRRLFKVRRQRTISKKSVLLESATIAALAGILVQSFLLGGLGVIPIYICMGLAATLGHIHTTTRT